MATLAVGFRGIDRRATHAAKYVDATRYGLQVRWVHAAGVSAEVVKHKAHRDGSHGYAIYVAMNRGKRNVPATDTSVAPAILATRPIPAACFLAHNNTLPEPRSQF